MTTAVEALEHFSTLVTAEVARELEKAAIAASRVQGNAIMAGAAFGSGMYVAIGQAFAGHLVTLREFIETAAAERLKPYTEHADQDTLVKLRRGALEAFDTAASECRAALQRYTQARGMWGKAGQDGRGGEEVLKEAEERERRTLEAALAFGLSSPGRGAGPSGHRLAAILATDIVGFSTLMAADEKATLEAVSASKTLIRETVEGHGGRLVKTMGDGTLNEFGSTLDAMQAALDVLTAIVKKNGDKPADKHIALRMGLAVGDISPDGEDIMGDTVNLAARLEAMAAPGTIATLEHVRDDLANKLELVSEDLGQQTLKGIARLVRVVQITPK
jgi:class 3 adenylate cyclase